MDSGIAEEDSVRILVTAVEARMLFEPLLGKHFANFHNELPVRQGAVVLAQHSLDCVAEGTIRLGRVVSGGGVGGGFVRLAPAQQDADVGRLAGPLAPWEKRACALGGSRIIGGCIRVLAVELRSEELCGQTGHGPHPSALFASSTLLQITLRNNVAATIRNPNRT